MLVYFSISLIVLLGFVGLAVDVGRMELDTIELQAVADDTALTAATEYQNGNSHWQTVSSAEAASLGASSGLSNVTSTFQIGANAGPYAANASVMQATVSQTIPLYFIPLVTGSKTKTVTAQAVAQFQPCSYFTTANPYSVSLDNENRVDSPCPVYAAGAISVDSSAFWNDLWIDVTGQASASSVSNMTAQPTYQQPVRTDPLAYLTPPVFQACTSGDSNLTISTTTILNPGTYCGGLTISTNTTVTLEPGLYIITGGFNLGLGSTLNGTGVTLYFTQGGGSSFGTIAIGNGSYEILSYVNLSAPTDSSAGGTPSIVLWIDPAWTGTNPVEIANIVWSGDGIIYSKTAGIFVYASKMISGTYFAMDVAYLEDSMTPIHLERGFSSLTTGNPFHVPAVLVQ